MVYLIRLILICLIIPIKDLYKFPPIFFVLIFLVVYQESTQSPNLPHLSYYSVCNMMIIILFKLRKEKIQ